MNIRNLSLFRLLIVLFVLVSLWMLYSSTQQSRNRTLRELTENITLAYESALGCRRMLAQVFYDTYEQQITEIFRHAYQAGPERRQEIREQLLDRMMQFYENNRQEGLKQFHFHLPNGDSFLRFHRPTRHGVNLMPFRHSVKIANTRHLYVQGFETGKIFDGFRYVYPLFFDGRHIGSVELSFDFNAIRKKLLSFYPYDYMLMLSKKRVEQKLFDQELSNYTTSPIHPDFLIEKQFHRLSKPYSTGLLTHLQGHTDIPDRLQSMQSFSEFVEFQGEQYALTFVVIENTQQQKAGYLVSISDPITNADSVINFSMLWQVSTVLVLFTLITFQWNRKLNEVNDALISASSELEKQNARLEVLSTTDALTQVANRMTLDQELGAAFLRFKRYQSPFSVILIDIDHFKRVNDQHGHLVGDAVLKEVSALIGQNIRDTDCLGRWGGEEFMLICQECSTQAGKALAEKLRCILQAHRFPEVDRLTASFGVTEALSGDREASDITARADSALYQSKSNGRNRVSVASARLNAP